MTTKAQILLEKCTCRPQKISEEYGMIVIFVLKTKSVEIPYSCKTSKQVEFVFIRYHLICLQLVKNVWETGIFMIFAMCY